jgi:3-hydroxybutyryl-CoA dehydrogenase
MNAEVQSIAVIGAGATGRGIAYASLLGGFTTVLEDISPQRLDEGVRWIAQTLAEGVSSGKLEPQVRDRALSLITTATSVPDAIRDADLIIEAVPEELEMKMELFTIFDKFSKPGAIFASSTSSLSITDMADLTVARERCIGMHFLNPIPQVKLIELVKTLQTSEVTVNACIEIGRRMGQEVVVGQETPGFITARINA